MQTTLYILQATWMPSWRAISLQANLQKGCYLSLSFQIILQGLLFELIFPNHFARIVISAYSSKPFCKGLLFQFIWVKSSFLHLMYPISNDEGPLLKV